eukprot:Rhum_TRINITY_DN18670_c0_g1::Rhum_TRINITY_DN18670_c0_g1_i1::g.168047::m.168047
MHRVTRAVTAALSSASSATTTTAAAATAATTPSLLRTAAHTARSQQRRDYTATEVRDSGGVCTVTCRTGLTASEEARTPESELLSAALAECVAAVDEARRFAPAGHPRPWGASWTTTCRAPFGTDAQKGAAAEAEAAEEAATGGKKKKKQKVAKKQKAADDAMAAAVASAAAADSTREPALVVMAHTHHGKGAVGKRFVETLQDEAKVPGWVADRLVGCAMHESGCPSIKTEAGEVLDTQVMLTALFLPEGAEYETTLAHRTSDGVPALPTGKHTLPRLPLREMRETLTPLVVGFSNAPASDASFTKTQALFPQSLVAMEQAEGAAGQAGVAAAAAPPGVYARRACTTR